MSKSSFLQNLLMKFWRIEKTKDEKEILETGSLSAEESIEQRAVQRTKENLISQIQKTSAGISEREEYLKGWLDISSRAERPPRIRKQLSKVRKEIREMQGTLAVAKGLLSDLDKSQVEFTK